MEQIIEELGDDIFGLNLEGGTSLYRFITNLEHGGIFQKNKEGGYILTNVGQDYSDDLEEWIITGNLHPNQSKQIN